MFPRLTRTNAQLLIVDVQTRLLPAVSHAEHVEKNIVLLATLARRLQLPVAVSEQNPAKIGGTTPAIMAALGEFTPVAKLNFSAWPGVQGVLDAERKNVMLCGLEAHICVTQTALDLIENGYSVFGIYDAISSRQETNRTVGWERMKMAGVVPASTEAALYELLGEAGTDDFRAMLPLVK